MNTIHEEVKLVPWQGSWEEIFAEEKNAIEAAFAAAGIFAEISHVGSTSVKGMISKPILDILVCPDKELLLDDCIPALEDTGYRNLGECGRKGRYFLSKGTEPNKTFYLHLCYADHQVAQDQKLFQFIERNDKSVFNCYLQLKRTLSELFPYERDIYRVEKGRYIESVLATYRLGELTMAAKISSMEDEDEKIKYWIYEFSMTDDARSEFDAICDRYELTHDEFFEAMIKDAVRRATEAPEEYKENIDRFREETKDDHRIELVRFYPVYKGKTEAQAYRRKLEEETEALKAVKSNK